MEKEKALNLMKIPLIEELGSTKVLAFKSGSAPQGEGASASVTLLHRWGRRGLIPTS